MNNDQQKLIEAEKLARELMTKWGATQDGWVFQWSNGKNQLGCAGMRGNRWTGEIKIKFIRLSRYLVLLNGWDEITDTILHEIAHTRAGLKAGHGPLWKAECLVVGAKPQRCADKSVNTPDDHKYEMVCTCCQEVVKKYYRSPSRKMRNTLDLRWGSCCGRKAKGKLVIRSVA